MVRGCGFFVAASCALLDIAEHKLFKEAGFSSFKQNALGARRLGLGLGQARRWVRAARVMRAIPAGVPWPRCERQVRPLGLQSLNSEVAALS